MNAILYIIVILCVMYILLKIHFMLQNNAPLIEKFIEAPYAKFRKQGGDESVLDTEEENMIRMDEYDLPMNYEIKKILANYLKSNENCEIGQSQLYYKIFVTALRNFIKYNFMKTLGYIPDNDNLSVKDTREYRIYKKALQNIPDCYKLMEAYLKIDLN